MSENKMTKSAVESMVAEQAAAAATAAVTPILDQIKALSDQLNAQPTQPVQHKHAGALFGGTGADAPKVEGEVKAIDFARYMKLVGGSKGDVENALFMAEKLYPEQKGLHSTMKTMMATNPSMGGILIPQNIATEIIPLLREQSLMRRLNVRRVPLLNGNLTMPFVKEGATVTYIGETQKIKKTGMKLGQTHMTEKKAAALVPISNDLMQTSAYDADALVLEELLQALANAEDNSMLYGIGTQFTPRGVVNYDGIYKEQLNAAVTADDIPRLIGKLAERMKNNAAPNLTWVIPNSLWSVLYTLKDANGSYHYKEEMRQGRLEGIPFQRTNIIPTGTDAHAMTELFLAEWSELMFGESEQFQAEISRDATITDEDGNTLSAFQQDITILRMIAKHDFGMRRPEGFVHISKVWTK